MSLHPEFPTSPYAPLIPEHCWFPADEALRSTAYDKLLPPLVAKVRKEVQTWRDKGHAGASATSVALLCHWFETEHLTENADGSLTTFRYYFAQREAVETVNSNEPGEKRPMANLRETHRVDFAHPRMPPCPT
jgi:type III restriction enzyme